MSTEKEIRLLQDKLDSHIKQCEERAAKQNERDMKQDERWEKVIGMNEDNARNIDILITSTAEIIKAWEASSTLGRFVKWLSGFAVLGVIGSWIADHIQ